MSQRQLSQLEQKRACDEFEDVMQRVQLDLAMNAPRRHLDMGIRCLELLVERTGGTWATDRYRDQLAAIKKTIAHRGFPRLARSN